MRLALNWALFRVWEQGRFTDLWLRYFPISPFWSLGSCRSLPAPGVEKQELRAILANCATISKRAG